jgi:hypothetical protein
MGSLAVLAVLVWFLFKYLSERNQSGGGAVVFGREQDDPNALHKVSSVLANDLKRLDGKQAGLGNAASKYVLTGDGGIVLSTLSVLKPADVLEINRPWLAENSPTLARRRLIGRGETFDFDVMQRYAELLAACCGQAPDAAAGSAAVPLAIRVLMSEGMLGIPTSLNTWPRKIEPLNGRGLLHNVAIELSRRLGGSRIDIIDVAYTKASGYSAVDTAIYRQAIDLKALLSEDPAATLEAAKRMNSAGRSDLIQDLSRLDLAFEPHFLGFFMEQAGDSAKATREAATATLVGAPQGMIEGLAAKLLAEGDVNQRSGMADLLGKLGTQAAMETLRAHRPNEKTARIVAAIDTALAVSDRTMASESVADTEGGYLGIDGSRVAAPPIKMLPDADPPKLTQADRDQLLSALRAHNEKVRAQNEENAKRGYKWKSPEFGDHLVGKIADYLETRGKQTSWVSREANLAHLLGWGPAAPWTRGWVAKLSEGAAMALAPALGGNMLAVLPIGRSPVLAERLADWLSGPEGDIRPLEAKDVENQVEVTLGGWNNRVTRMMQRGDHLRMAIGSGYTDVSGWLAMPRDAVWPYIAANFDVFDEAFGLKPPNGDTLDKVKAISALAILPVTPTRYFGPLLEMATGVTRSGRAEARAMLAAAPDVGARLIALLDDSRQAVRAGAAEWLADRKDEGAVAALKARLKKEKSEIAQAGILSALKKLGEDISGFVGPKALIAEAEKGLKSAKLDKLAWLGLDAMPRMQFRDGSGVPPEVLKWWIALAVKLKQPGESGLFSIYLDQLRPGDTKTFSTWLLDAWISYDTAVPSDEEANTYAKANAQARYQGAVRWIKDYTEERAFADLRREFKSNYLHSGADTKGLLALATRAPSALAADRTRAYLKNHGSRTSQASSLLEMLAGMGDPVALQVVIAAATRLKQKGVQKFAGELITRVAEANGWTLDELADRTIPTAGFDDDGVLALACGEDGKVYEGRLNAKLEIVLRNPAGKEVAGLPSGADEATGASKKQLATSKKELKQVIAMQTARLYEALCAERTWLVDDWLRLFHDHPVMRKLVERVVWTGLDADGNPSGSFRPTAEGDFSDQADSPVDVRTFSSVRLAHGALMNTEHGKVWDHHLKDYEVQPLFAQFGRTLMRIAPEQAKQTEITDRKGWLTDAFIIRGAAGKLGYERGPPLDGGFFNEYRKPFGSAGLDAVIEFTGNSLPEENVPAAIVSLKFERHMGPGRAGSAMRLGDVPPVLLSECWNDYHAFAAKGAFDKDWEKKSPW